MKFVARVTYDNRYLPKHHTCTVLVEAENRGRVYGAFQYDGIKSIEVDIVEQEIIVPQSSESEATFTDVLREMKEKTVETATKMAQHPVTQEVKEVGQMMVEEIGKVAEEMKKFATKLKDAIVNFPKE